MRLNLGWDRSTCAKNFHVTPRTLHNWESGKTDIPYTAYRLLRLLNRMELPGESWSGWCFVGGVLYTPENYPITGHDGTWWSLLVRQAAMFGELMAVRGAEGRAAAGMAAPHAAARAPAPADGAHAPGGREAHAPLPSNAWHPSQRFLQAAPRALPMPLPHGNHGENNLEGEPHSCQSDVTMTSLWQQPSGYPPTSKPTPARAASASGSVSTPLFASHWTLTFAVSVALGQQRQQAMESQQASPLLRLQWQHPLSLQGQPTSPLVRVISPPRISPASSAAPCSPSESAEAPLGYGAKPHVQTLTREGPAQRLPAATTRRKLAVPGPVPASGVSVTFAQVGGYSRALNPASDGRYSRPGKPVFGIQSLGDYPNYSDGSNESIISKGSR